VVVKSLTVAPDPITIPGTLTLSGTVSCGETISSPLKVRAGATAVGQGRAELPRSPSSWEMPGSGHGNEQPLGERGTEQCRAERTGLCTPRRGDGRRETCGGSRQPSGKLPNLSSARNHLSCVVSWGRNDSGREMKPQMPWVLPAVAAALVFQRPAPAARSRDVPGHRCGSPELAWLPCTNFC